MAGGTRDRMVRAAADLFRDRGYDGTGFRDVVEAAGTARGVIYHHFPGGKAELGASVVQVVGEQIAARVEAVCAVERPQVAVTVLLDVVERTLVRGGSRPGCPIVAVALAADDDEGTLRGAAETFFARARAAVTGCLRRDGIGAAEAEAFAALAVSACEGAVVLSRARRGSEPLQQVRSALLDYVDRLPRVG